MIEAVFAALVLLIELTYRPVAAPASRTPRPDEGSGDGSATRMMSNLRQHGLGAGDWSLTL